MKLRPAPLARCPDIFEGMDREFARYDALRAMGLPFHPAPWTDLEKQENEMHEAWASAASELDKSWHCELEDPLQNFGQAELDEAVHAYDEIRWVCEIEGMVDHERAVKKQCAIQIWFQICEDRLKSASLAAASTFESAQQNSFQAHDLPTDPQSIGLGLAFLTLTPRILAQRPITARVTRAC